MARHEAEADAARRLARLVSARPIQAGSLIVTLFGDAIVPRGGVLGLSALTRLVEPFGLNSGQVRTALSRLVADGWFVRTREGRSSYYALATDRVADFRSAAARVYAAAEPEIADAIEQVIIVEDDPVRRACLRDDLFAQGFRPLAANVLIRPLQDEAAAMGPAPALIRTMLGRLDGSRTDLRALAASTWPIAALAESFRAFVTSFGPIAEAGTRGWSDEQSAFVARVLLIHEFRRLVLRDPGLPAALLPADWPGAEARRLCASLYRRVLPASERWLDAQPLALQQAGPELLGRFGSAGNVTKIVAYGGSV